MEQKIHHINSIRYSNTLKYEKADQNEGKTEKKIPPSKLCSICVNHIFLLFKPK